MLGRCPPSQGNPRGQNQLTLAGDNASVRCLFAFFGGFERNGDISTATLDSPRIASRCLVNTILNMSKHWSAESCFLMLSCLTFALPAPAAQQIKIEIVNRTWAVGAGHNGPFHAKAILPDGAHVMLVCQSDEKSCGFFPEKLSDTSGCDREHMVVTCSVTDLGYFSARREGDDVSIFGSHGKHKYRIVGSW